MLLFYFSPARQNRLNKKHHNLKLNEVVDIRLYADGKVRFNGSMISGSSLPGYIENLNTSESTRARVILDENAHTGLVNKTQLLIFKNRITNVYMKMLPAKEFKKYNQNKVHIDVLSSGKILLKGNKIYSEDLDISLENTE